MFNNTTTIVVFWPFVLKFILSQSIINEHNVPVYRKQESYLPEQTDFHHANR